MPADEQPQLGMGAGDRPKPQPLYLRMYFQDHLTSLVRMVGYAGFPVTEAEARLRPLIERFGRDQMKAAADEIVEIDTTQEPPVARLTAHARKLARGLLGRPPEERPPAAAPEPVPVAQPEQSAEPRSAKPRTRKRTAAPAAETPQPTAQRGRKPRPKQNAEHD